jgi:sugar/nucleoside kinase (ribokinase family)
MEVLVIGRSCLDYIAVVEEFPGEGEKRPLEFRLTEGGGQGATASCCIARLGGRVTYVGKLGDDQEGRFCLQRLSDYGVAADHVQIVANAHTPIAYVFVTRSGGERTIVYESSRLPPIALDEPLTALLRQAPVVLLDPEVTYLAEAVQRTGGGKSRIVYDCERWRAGLRQMMQAADYFIPSADFLRAGQLGLAQGSFENRLLGLKKQLAGELVVTRGAQGAYFIDSGQLYQVLPPRVEVVDTIGAGDNFHAAFALAISRGMALAGAVKFAVAVASLSCRGYGGRNAIPDWGQARQVASGLRARKIVAP